MSPHDLFLLVLGAAIGMALNWAWSKFSVKVAENTEYLRHLHELNLAEESERQADAELVWAKVNAAAPTIGTTDATQEQIRRDQWDTALGLIFAAGQARGDFAIRTLTPDVMSADDWNFVTRHLRGCNILQKDKGDRARTIWADGMDLEKAMGKLERHEIPCPTGRAPEVNFAGNGGQVKRVKQANGD